MSGMLIKGDLRLAYVTDQGQVIGYLNKVFNGTTCEIVPGQPEVKERKSKGRVDYGQTLDAVSVPSGYTLNVSTDSMTKEVLGMALQANVEDVNLGGSFTDEPVTVHNNLWVRVGPHLSISSQNLVVTSTDGATTFAIGVDYEIDHRNGMIMALPTGNIPDGSAVHVSGETAVLSGYKLATPGQNARVRVLFDGTNYANGERVMLTVFNIKLSPSSGTNLLNDEFLAADFTGTPLPVPGKDLPFEFLNLGKEL